ncbi:MAG: hypothetical protein MRY74_02010 [Neomegalonema sp.]|nr:hypothetical protein [Neomegalonema sp.]
MSFFEALSGWKLDAMGGFDRWFEQFMDRHNDPVSAPEINAVAAVAAVAATIVAIGMIRERFKK